MDYNLTPAHRLSFVYRYNDFNSTPDFLNSADPTLPGLPELGPADLGPLHVAGDGAFDASARTWSTRCAPAQQDAIGKGHVASARTSRADMFNCTGVGLPVGRRQGLELRHAHHDSGAMTPVDDRRDGLRRPVAPASPRSSRSKTTLNWLKGKHSISRRLLVHARSTCGTGPTRVPTQRCTSAPPSVDPAYNMLDADLGRTSRAASTRRYAGYARNLYGLLTGRVTGFGGTALPAAGRHVRAQRRERTNRTIADELRLLHQRFVAHASPTSRSTPASAGRSSCR